MSELISGFESLWVIPLAFGLGWCACWLWQHRRWRMGIAYQRDRERRRKMMHIKEG